MKLLIGIRMKAMFAAMKKSFGGKKGMGALIAVCMVFLLFSVEAMLFGAWNLLGAFLETDFAWLYFALAGLLAFALGIFGTVFTTQSQMYQAKDNELLLAMPLKPGSIVGSRVFVLYLLTMLFVVVVMLPAGLVYTIKAGFSVSFWLVYPVSMVLIVLITQAVTCLLGWLLHFILAGFRHKAIVATVFMTAVMILYFIGINQIENLMLLLVNNGGKIASAIQSFAWPFYALGVACFGDWLQFALLALVCVSVFAVVTVVLNRTFVKAMLMGGKTKRAAKQKRDDKVRSAMGAVCRKECKRFFSSTTYLVNIGMGLFMIVAFVGAGVMLAAFVLATGVAYEYYRWVFALLEPGHEPFGHFFMPLFGDVAFHDAKWVGAGSMSGYYMAPAGAIPDAGLGFLQSDVYLVTSLYQVGRLPVLAFVVAVMALAVWVLVRTLRQGNRLCALCGIAVFVTIAGSALVSLAPFAFGIVFSSSVFPLLTPGFHSVVAMALAGVALSALRNEQLPRAEGRLAYA